MSKWDDIIIEQQQADALYYMGEAEWRDTFEERHGWAPDYDYENIKCNKSKEEYGKESGLHDKDAGWDVKVCKRASNQ